jgi:hypothetical protein
MNFIFVCPTHNRTFESADFSITENRGVEKDDFGTKVLAAKVKLDSPCPYCGAYHIYEASELSCPFSAGGGKE